MTRADVARITRAATALVEAHKRRSPSSENSTLAEDDALWELNFHLGVYRQKKGMAR